MICALFSLFWSKICGNSIQKIKKNQNAVLPITNDSRDFLSKNKSAENCTIKNKTQCILFNTSALTVNNCNDCVTINSSTQSVISLKLDDENSTFSSNALCALSNMEHNLQENEINMDKCGSDDCSSFDQTLEYFNPISLVDNEPTFQ